MPVACALLYPLPVSVYSARGMRLPVNITKTTVTFYVSGSGGFVFSKKRKGNKSAFLSELVERLRNRRQWRKLGRSVEKRGLSLLNASKTSYGFFAGVFVLVAIAAVDWTATRSAANVPVAVAVESLVTVPNSTPRKAAVPQFDKLPEAPSLHDIDHKPFLLFHPLWTADGSATPLLFETASHPELPTDVRVLVDDPEDKLEREFKVPKWLRQRTVFWMLIHAAYSSQMRLIHDRDNPAILYGYIDFRPIYRSAESARAADGKAYRLEQQILKELKARLIEAVSEKPGPILSSDERTKVRDFLSQVGALSGKETPALIGRIRTQTGQSDQFLAALQRSRLLLPHIETVLRRQGLPVALARIPFVESSFNVRAHSKVGAVGIWQFMPATARQMMGASEKGWADPLKQTVAAAKLLRMFRSLLPDWSTAVTSYNSGVGRLRRLAQRNKATTLEKILLDTKENGLGFAGENFYAQFLSANLIEAYKEELFEKLLNPVDVQLVLKGMDPFPRASCDL